MSATTILYDERVTGVTGTEALGERLWLAPADLQAATGWKLEAEGLCRGAACVRLDAQWLDDEGRVDLVAFARHMGQPITRDETQSVWALGESVSARHDALCSLEAPDFSLPDLDGVMHALSDYRGKKVFLYSWGSY